MKKNKYDKNSIDDYIKVHNLAIGFKNGNRDDGLELLKCFKGYISHYVDLIKFGEFEYTNKSIREFIKIFHNNTSKVKLNFNSKFAHCWTEESKRISKLFSNLDKEDVKSLIQYSILNMAKHYKCTEPRFHSYISKCLHFFVYNEVKKYICDPLSNFIDLEFDNDDNQSFYIVEKIISKKNINNNSNNEDIINMIDINTKINSSNIAKKTDNVNNYDDNFLDINWINGITCSDIFKDLTTFERKILIEHEINKKTDTDIANEYGYVRATINRKRLKAISKINLKEV